MSGYRTIVIDPPWPMPTGGPRGGSRVWNQGLPSALPYKSMTISEIAALPIHDLAAADSCLYLWTVNAFLERSYELARIWLFRPSQILVWAKSPRGLGMGGAFTNTTEFVLFARRGRPQVIERVDSSWWNWKRGPHSVKPDAFLDLVERVSPAPRLEMFARRQRIGWDTWGNEALEHVAMPVNAPTTLPPQATGLDNPRHS
jgi:N6-adenosine-specific RNA methylase IME4